MPASQFLISILIYELKSCARPDTAIRLWMAVFVTLVRPTPPEPSGIPLLRTWQRGAVHFQWRSDHIITEGFLDQRDPPQARLLSWVNKPTPTASHPGDLDLTAQ
jgi:hypothetical protein